MNDPTTRNGFIILGIWICVAAGFWWLHRRQKARERALALRQELLDRSWRIRNELHHCGFPASPRALPPPPVRRPGLPRQAPSPAPPPWSDASSDVPVVVFDLDSTDQPQADPAPAPGFQGEGGASGGGGASGDWEPPSPASDSLAMDASSAEVSN